MMELERIPPVPEGAVLCRSTGYGAGCGHPVDWHTGPGTVAPGCDCCSWRKNEAAARMDRLREVPPEKLSVMNRAQRRAAMRGRR